MGRRLSGNEGDGIAGIAIFLINNVIFDVIFIKPAQNLSMFQGIEAVFYGKGGKYMIHSVIYSI